MNYKTNISACPFVKNPFPDCYCFNMTSRNIDTAIVYCGNKFKECAIYKNNFFLKGVVTQKIMKTL
jgi:hypothetical protein